VTEDYSPNIVEGKFCDFAFTAFSEVELLISRFLGSSRPEIATWHTKIAHMGDAPHPARLVA
jgi:hypothetical protein